MCKIKNQRRLKFLPKLFVSLFPLLCFSQHAAAETIFYSDRLSFHAEANVAWLSSDDLSQSVESGANEARLDGFGVNPFADTTDASFLPRIRLSYDIVGDGGKGTHSLSLSTSYSSYQFNGGFDAVAPGANGISRGSQKVDLWQIQAGYSYEFTDTFGVEFDFGYADFDFEDQSTLDFFVDNQLLFSESNTASKSEGTATVGIGINYRLTDHWSITGRYQQMLSDVGFVGDKPSSVSLGARYDFSLGDYF